MTTVLIVDDEAPIQRAMRANLEARDYDVLAVKHRNLPSVERMSP